MSIIDTAKKLLQKAIDLNDDELIKIANALLEDELDATVKDVSQSRSRRPLFYSKLGRINPCI